MQDALYQKIASRMERIGCPVCLNTRFSVVLRCDLSPGDSCLLVGECQHCANKFDILNVATLDEMQAHAERLFLPQPCPCGGSTRLQFWCDLKSEDCYFAGVCADCGASWRVFPGVPGPETGQPKPKNGVRGARR